MNDIANSPLARRKYIEGFVDKLYGNDKINFLFPEPINQFKQYALDMFLDANLSYEQITDSIIKLAEERKKSYDAKMAIEKRKKEIRDVVSKIYNDNQDLFISSLEQMQNDYVEIYLSNNQASINDIENRLRQTVNELRTRKNNQVVPASEPVLVEKTTTPVITTNNSSFIVSTNGEIPKTDTESHDSEYSLGQNQKDVDSYAENKANETAMGALLSGQTAVIGIANKPNEIAEMVNNEPSVDIVEDKQLVKTPTNTGAVSLFNVVLSILAITSFVLVAMILNLLLK